MYWGSVCDVELNKIQFNCATPSLHLRSAQLSLPDVQRALLQAQYQLVVLLYLGLHQLLSELSDDHAVRLQLLLCLQQFSPRLLQLLLYVAFLRSFLLAHFRNLRLQVLDGRFEGLLLLGSLLEGLLAVFPRPLQLVVQLLDVFFLLQNQILQHLVPLVVQFHVLLVRLVVLDHLLFQLVFFDLRFKLKPLRLCCFHDLIFLIILPLESFYFLFELGNLVLEYLYGAVLLERRCAVHGDLLLVRLLLVSVLQFGKLVLVLLF